MSERLSGSTLLLLLHSLPQASPPGQHLPLHLPKSLTSDSFSCRQSLVLFEHVQYSECAVVHIQRAVIEVMVVLVVMEGLVVLEELMVLEELVALVGHIFKRGIYFFQIIHGATSPGLSGLWGLWL